MPPLEVQSWPACERSAADYNAGPPGAAQRIEPVAVAELRGVPARFYGDGSVELSAGAVTIFIFGHSREDLVAAAGDLRTEPTAPVSVSQRESLPPPVSGAQSGTLSC
jgi:hypothetical protein